MHGYTEYEKAADAATGYEVREPLKPGRTLPKPYPAGFYDQANKQFVLNSHVPESVFGEGIYRFHKIGTVPMPNANCCVWLGRSWAMSFPAAVCYRPGCDDRFDVWVSLKFSPDGTVACDRVVFVRH